MVRVDRILTAEDFGCRRCDKQAQQFRNEGSIVPLLAPPDVQRMRPLKADFGLKYWHHCRRMCLYTVSRREARHGVTALCRKPWVRYSSKAVEHFQMVKNYILRQWPFSRRRPAGTAPTHCHIVEIAQDSTVMNRLLKTSEVARKLKQARTLIAETNCKGKETVRAAGKFQFCLQ